MNESLEYKVKTLPLSPGVYNFLDENGTVIYVGKAKNLRNRVSSYFREKNQVGKTAILVKHIHDLLHICVDTETDALLLENKLIKKFQPRYNILLKDDKTYPWICITNEDYPRVFFTRKKLNNGSQYYGPYTSIFAMREVLDMIRRTFSLRTCRTPLTEENVKKGKYDVCLDYHIKNCCAPCIGDVSKEEYANNLNSVRKILSGRTAEVLNILREQMMELSAKLEFEKAQIIKEKYDLLNNYHAKNVISVYIPNTVEVYSILKDERDDYYYINFMKVSNSIIIRSFTREIKDRADESPQDILATTLADIHFSEFNIGETATEFILPFEIEFDVENIKSTVPKTGDKKQLLDWSLRNCRLYMSEQQRQRTLVDPDASMNNLMKKMKDDLQLDVEPRHIECFDNSNIQGTNPVSSCVVFRNGKPYKRDYRLFNVKTVVGADDFATMREIVYRRYKRLSEEGKELPQLIVIDGGKGQLRCAYETLQALGLDTKIAVIGLAKRLEEIFYPNDPIPLYLDRTSPTLKVIQHLRDEAHRFGITFHRNKRSKGMIHSILEDIQGIGDKTIGKLLTTFGSVNKISELPLIELRKVVNLDRAMKIYQHFHPEDNNPALSGKNAAETPENDNFVE
ncbi:MAG: excinuclease ABC subunit C [Bacteroidales bacterium]|nr:excinuclease ABC subunit C [Bacteroidales bacterium]